MKVLHVLYALRPSGMEKMLYDSAEYWKNHGVEIEILANDDNDGPFAGALREKGYRIICIPWRESRRHLIDFYKLIKREQYEVIHIHPIRGYWGFAIVAKLAGVKRIFKHFHNCFSSADPLRYLWHFAQRHTIRLLKCISFSPSLSVQENEQKRYYFPTSLIWNWVDERKFSFISLDEKNRKRLATGITKDRKVILSVGNCHTCGTLEQKNHQLILRAIALIQAPLKSRLLYIHVGQEMDGFPERSLAKELGVEGCVSFMGPSDCIHDLLSCADLFVMSSIREGLGNSTIEALLSGVPVLITWVQGLQDFGKIIPHINYTDLKPETMAKRIEELLLTDQDELRDKAKESAKSALKYFSVEGSCSKLLAFYRGRAK